MTSKLQKLDDEYKNLIGEYNIMKCRLDSKTEALLILSKELDKYRSERDQFKLMASQLRERYNALKKRIEGWGPSLLGVYDIRGFKGDREQSLAQLLCELKEQNKSLMFEVNDLKQKLSDAQGDIKLLREQIARQRLGSADEGVVIRHFPAYEREDLVKQLEAVRQKCFMLEKDLQAVLDEKEELVTARDAYCHKVDRLNHQLNCMLRGDKEQIVDIDAILMDNRFLQERLKQVQEEKAMVTATLSKYKSVLEKKRTRNGIRFNTLGSGIISSKQLQQLLQTNPFLEITNNPNTVTDLRNLVVALFESLNDKTLALSHQKKANKILGNRVTELEKKIKAIELSHLWNLQDSTKMCTNKICCEEEKVVLENNPITPTPPTCTKAVALTTSNLLKNEEVEEAKLQDEDYENTSSEVEKRNRSGSGFSDLDLLPTKESPVPSESFVRSSSSCSSHLSSHPSTPLRTLFQENRDISSDSEIPSRSSDSDFQRQRYLSEESSGSQNDDNLPPQLQKLLDAALAEIEQQNLKKAQSASKNVNKEKEDPNC
ncbi:coiled-coil domain-containing protein 149-like [Centruroides sculpturatus]|uniref:coiled-coil domain-containing protein 149-like n=1 Tax=Centruroides sculpturatus TaxID=218467 RepID=UPI000C6DE31F|nr:coiled-coil domain-containing protein 149-like [Centruroides sculpturatus]